MTRPGYRHPVTRTKPVMATAQTIISATYVIVCVAFVGFIVVLLCEEPVGRTPRAMDMAISLPGGTFSAARTYAICGGW
jgi:hypothetical protein